MKNLAYELLNYRGISNQHIIRLINEIQDDKNKLSEEKYVRLIENILSVKEIVDFVIFGIILDIYAENNLLPDPLQYMLSGEDPLFNLNRLVSLTILNEFGTDAILNYSYLLKTKKEIIDDMVSHNSVNTFLTNILCVIASVVSVNPF